MVWAVRPRWTPTPFSIRSSEQSKANPPRPRRTTERISDDRKPPGEGSEEPEALLRDLGDLLEAHAGILRDEEGLREEWRRNLVYERALDGMAFGTKVLGTPSAEVRKALNAGYELDYHQLE